MSEARPKIAKITDAAYNYTPSDPGVEELVALRTNELLKTLDIPQSPPPYLRSGAPVGLELLDLILQPRHVLRLSESLYISRTTHIQRDLTVDISIARLTSSQRRSAQQYSDYRKATGSEQQGTVQRLDSPETQDHNEHSVFDRTSGSRRPIGRLWLPILQISRQEGGPVRVKANDGQWLPMAAQREVTSVLTAAMVHIFVRECDRLLERGDDSDVEIMRIRSVRHEREFSRWLIFRMLEALSRDGLPAESVSSKAEANINSYIDNTDRPADLDDRSLAMHVMKSVLSAEVLGPLLALVSTSQFIVIGVMDDQDEQTLTVSTPRLQIDAGTIARSRRGRPGLQRVLAFVGRFTFSPMKWLSYGRIFGGTSFLLKYPLGIWRRFIIEVNRHQSLSIRYATPLPSVATSYHLFVRCDDDLTIETALLLSNEDVRGLDELTRRAQFSTDSMAEYAQPPFVSTAIRLGTLKSHLLESEETVQQLGALIESRMQQARAVRRQFGLTHLQAPFAKPLEEVSQRRLVPLLRDVTDIQNAYKDLRDQAELDLLDTNDQIENAVNTAVNLGGQLVSLCERAGVNDRLESGLSYNSCEDVLELGTSLTSDDDPRESEVHLHRREQRRRRRGQSVGVHQATVLLDLRESTPALRGRVLATVLPVALVVYAIAAIRFDTWQWPIRAKLSFDSPAQADALITVLLLVPGLLISRLDVTRGSSLIAVIRTFPRAIAYTSVASTTGLAAVVAGGAEGRGLFIAFLLSFCSLVFLTVLQMIDVMAARWSQMPRAIVDIPTMPRWLVHDGLSPRGKMALDVDVRSDSGAMS